MWLRYDGGHWRPSGTIARKNGVVVGQYHPDRKQRCRSRVCITPVSSLRGRLPLISASDTGIIPHSLSIHGRTDACYPGGECDKMGKPGTESALFYIKFWAMAFPSDHLVDSKSKWERKIRVWIVIIALNVVWKAVWHRTTMFALNSWSNRNKYLIIHTNTCTCIPDTCHNIYYIGLEVQIKGPYQHVLRSNTCQYMCNTCQYIPQYMPIRMHRAKTCVLHRTLIHAIT